jgi:hypothetical protein
MVTNNCFIVPILRGGQDTNIHVYTDHISLHHLQLIRKF